MTAAITADTLLARLKVRAQVPDLAPQFGSTSDEVDAELLRILDDAIDLDLGVEVVKASDGRHMVEEAVTLVASQSDYRLPWRCWAGGLDRVEIINSNGDKIPLDYIEPQDEYDHRSANGIWPAPKYTIEGDILRLVPTPTSVSGFTLKVHYVRRPSQLVKTSACVLTTAVAASTLTGTIPAAWSSPTTIDVVRASHAATPLEDSVAVTFTGSTITRSSGSFETTSTAALVVETGDYACLEGQTCIPQIPTVAIPFVLDRAAVTAAIVMGDMENAQLHAESSRVHGGKVLRALAKRSGRAPKVIDFNSPLRNVAGRRRRGLWWRSS